MNQRPRSITIISWIFIVFGCIVLIASLLSIAHTPAAQRLPDFKTHWMVHVARLAALVSGLFMLYGFNWARCLLVAWLGFHVVIGLLHSKFELAVHSVLFLVVVYF